MSELKVIPEPQKILTEQFGDAIELHEFRGELTVVVGSENLLAVAQYCRDFPDLDYNYLSDVSALDYYPQEPRFGVNIHLYSLRKNRRLRLRVMWSDGDPDIPSMTALWPSANWFERETYDMYGIPFDGHPDLRRIMMPEDWDGHPLRKDYPLGYETVQFSFNYDDVNKHKPYAKK